MRIRIILSLILWSSVLILAQKPATTSSYHSVSGPLTAPPSKDTPRPPSPRPLLSSSADASPPVSPESLNAVNVIEAAFVELVATLGELNRAMAGLEVSADVLQPIASGFLATDKLLQQLDVNIKKIKPLPQVPPSHTNVIVGQGSSSSAILVDTFQYLVSKKVELLEQKLGDPIILQLTTGKDLTMLFSDTVLEKIPSTSVAARAQLLESKETAKTAFDDAINAFKV